MPSKEVMERLLAAKRAASAICDEFKSARADETLTREQVEDCIRRYAWSKYRLTPEEGRQAGDGMVALAEASLAKMLRIAPDMVGTEDKAANCDGADSVDVKQALLILRMGKEFDVRFSGFQAALCKDIPALATLIWKAL